MISSTPIFNSDIYTDFMIYNDKSHSEYLVTSDKEEGTVYCTCPDFKYRRQTEKFGGAKLTDKEHHCKHIREVLHE